jgi:AcrR family transcriptional regulator
MADVADVAGVGRTTVYRQYPNRDDLVHGVLARELRDVLALIADVTSRQNTIEDKIVAAAVACLQALEESVVQRLLCTDPATFLPFLTTEAGPLLAIARDSLAAQIRAVEPKTTRQEAAEIAEAAARLGLSFVLTPQTIVPLDDPAATTASLRRIVGPLLVRAHTADDRTPA